MIMIQQTVIYNQRRAKGRNDLYKTSKPDYEQEGNASKYTSIK